MDALLQATSTLAGIPLAAVRDLACTLTGSEGPDPVRRGRSGLNHDGAPLQLCVGLGRDGPRYRLLGDPASDVVDIGLRFRRSLRTTDSILASTGSGAIEPAIASTLNALVGDDGIFHPDHYPDGVVWLGAPLAGPGIALYVDARDGGRDPEKRLRAWLASVLRFGDDAECLVRTVMSGRIMSAGIEGVAPGYARAKAYWRLATPTALSDLPIDLFHAPAFARAVDLVFGERVLPLDSIVLSAGLALPGGELVDAKLDICCCPRCVRLSTGEAAYLIGELARTFDLPEPDLTPLLEAGELAFIGFGLDRAGEARLNIYLKPVAEGRPC